MPNRKLPRGGGTQVALSPELALAAIGIFSTLVDEESYNADETYALNEMLTSTGLYDDYADEDFENLGKEIGSLISHEGLGSVVAQAIATAREEELEEAAFIVAVVIVAADGEVPEEEQDYIDNLHQALGISAERASEIIDELFSEDEEDEEDEE
jgi:tellurite resistance protein